MHPDLLDILACPICGKNVFYQPVTQELICLFDKIAYPIDHQIPVMITDKARRLSLKEYEQLRDEVQS